MAYRIIIIALYIFFSPSAFAQDRAAQRFSGIFCSYVNIFLEQILLQRERNVPFSRLDVFNYFSEEEGEFLREHAIQIYQENFIGRGARYEAFVLDVQQECRDRFPGAADE